MAQLLSSQVVEPFGEVNVNPASDGGVAVRATILMTPAFEGAQTGLAIDASASMRNAFGGGGAVSALFASSMMPNIVQPVARALAGFLANFDTDGETTVIYWACGPGGNSVEELGDMTGEAAAQKEFKAPKQFGTGTRLLPALKYFLETRFTDAPWGVFVFITDGAIEDFEEVKSFTLEVAGKIADGTRGFTKLILIGAGAEVDAAQLESLDDLDYGGLKDFNGDTVDLWDYKLAAEMQKLEEIFAEVVSANTILAPSAQIADNNGNPAQRMGGGSYSDGLPALLEFTLPAGATAFTLTMPDGMTITQPLTS